MKILVGVKRVVDYNVRVQLSERGGALALDLEHLKMSMNPFDEIALEEALRLRESGAAAEVIAVSIGAPAAAETLRQALALGADRAILITAEPMPQPLDIARILQKLALEEQAKLVLLGKQAIDDDSGQTGQMLAAMLGWAQGCCASKVTIAGAEALVERETDKGAESLALTLPAVITADLRLNEPRYASLANIMKARKKTVEQRSAAELGIAPQPQLRTLRLERPKKRGPAVMLKTADELAEKLRAEGLIA